MAISSVNGASVQQVQQVAPTANERATEEAVREQKQEVSEDEVEISPEAQALNEGQEAEPTVRAVEETQEAETSEEEAPEQSSGGDVNDLAGLINSGQGGSRQGTILDTSA